MSSRSAAARATGVSRSPSPRLPPYSPRAALHPGTALRGTRRKPPWIPVVGPHLRQLLCLRPQQPRHRQRVRGIALVLTACAPAVLRRPMRNDLAHLLLTLPQQEPRQSLVQRPSVLDSPHPLAIEGSPPLERRPALRRVSYRPAPVRPAARLSRPGCESSCGCLHRHTCSPSSPSAPVSGHEHAGGDMSVCSPAHAPVWSTRQVPWLRRERQLRCRRLSATRPRVSSLHTQANIQTRPVPFVVPTHVGVNRLPTKEAYERLSCPHARGGEPIGYGV